MNANKKQNPNENATHLPIVFLTLIVILIGCETGENPVCTDTYCITGEIFAKADLPENQDFSELPAHVDEAEIMAMLRGDRPLKIAPTVKDLRTLYGEVTGLDYVWGHVSGKTPVGAITLRSLDFQKYKILLEPLIDEDDISYRDMVVVRLASDFTDGKIQYTGTFAKNISKRLTFQTKEHR